MNSNGVLNTATPSNDSNVNPVQDYNSIQPQSNNLGDNQGGLNMMGSDQVNSLSQEPNTMGQDTVAPVTEDTPFAPVTEYEVNNTSIPSQPMPETATPVVENTIETAMPETATPVVENTMQAPMPEATPAPVISDIPMQEVSAPPVVEEAPVVAQMETPVMPDSASVNTNPVMEQPSMENDSMDVLGNSAPVMPETPSVQPTEGVQDSVMSAPAPEASQPAFPNLSEPLQSPPTSTEISQEVNTLQESKGEEKESNVVIIVLILIIVLLLAGIGYFGYQIFLA